MHRFLHSIFILALSACIAKKALEPIGGQKKEEARKSSDSFPVKPKAALSPEEQKIAEKLAFLRELDQQKLNEVKI